MADNDKDVTVSNETRKDLIYKTGWLTVLPIGIWYMFNFLFNVGALSFYGINSGYTRMYIEIDFFSLISTGCFFLVYFVFLYNLLKERIRLYKVLAASTAFFVTMILVLVNTWIGVLTGILLLTLFLYLFKKGVLKSIPIYKKNIILFLSFLSLVILSFSSGYYYSKRFADYYCISNTTMKRFSDVLVARTANNLGVFVEADNIRKNSFNKTKYKIMSLENIELKKCETH